MLDSDLFTHGSHVSWHPSIYAFYLSFAVEINIFSLTTFVCVCQRSTNTAGLFDENTVALRNWQWKICDGRYKKNVFPLRFVLNIRLRNQNEMLFFQQIGPQRLNECFGQLIRAFFFPPFWILFSALRVILFVIYFSWNPMKPSIFMLLFLFISDSSWKVRSS